MIEVTDLTVRYGTALALVDASDRVAAGTWVGLIGPNGAGKTTLLRRDGPSRGPRGRGEARWSRDFQALPPPAGPDCRVRSAASRAAS